MMNNEMTIEELFQVAKAECKKCYYAYHDKHKQNVDYTSPNQDFYAGNVMNTLQIIINTQGRESYDGKIARDAQEICRRGCIDKNTGKPKTQGIMKFLRGCRV